MSLFTHNVRWAESLLPGYFPVRHSPGCACSSLKFDPELPVHIRLQKKGDFYHITAFEYHASISKFTRHPTRQLLSTAFCVYQQSLLLIFFLLNSQNWFIFAWNCHLLAHLIWSLIKRIQDPCYLILSIPSCSEVPWFSFFIFTLIIIHGMGLTLITSRWR